VFVAKNVVLYLGVNREPKKTDPGDSAFFTEKTDAAD